MIKANENDCKGRKVGQAKAGGFGGLPRSGLVHQVGIFSGSFRFSSGASYDIYTAFRDRISSVNGKILKKLSL
jgi:hypothetical protein